MLDKCEEGTRNIHQNQFQSAIVSNAFSVASARDDERESRESRTSGETNAAIDRELFRFSPLSEGNKTLMGRVL